jgi:crotonobetainyl-CoA:carnitine CoA-transferase CaiB-like acyl-CoA transferase
MAIPMCGLLLADMGADVVKLEPPTGDSIRSTQTSIVPGESKGFTIYNRGKRSICLDITRPESRPAFDALLTWADIVLMSLKPSDLERYGMDYAHCADVNPRVIYLECTPYGTEGPMGADGGYDVVVQGMSGLGVITDKSDGEAPGQIRPAYIDTGTGFLSALAVVAALRHRDRTGIGQRVQTSLLQTGLAFGANLVNWFGATDPPVWDEFESVLQAARSRGANWGEQRRLYQDRLLSGGLGNVYFRHYRTADGFISVGCLSPGLNRRFRDATGLRDPRTEPGWVQNAPDSRDRLLAMIAESEANFLRKTSAEWIAFLKSKSVPCGPFNFPTDVFDDEQILANNFTAELEHPVLGPYKTFAPPIRMDATPTRIRKSAPQLGADTAEVLSEAGLDARLVGELIESGAAGAPHPD